MITYVREVDWYVGMQHPPLQTQINNVINSEAEKGILMDIVVVGPYKFLLMFKGIDDRD